MKKTFLSALMAVAAISVATMTVACDDNNNDPDPDKVEIPADNVDDAPMSVSSSNVITGGILNKDITLDGTYTLNGRVVVPAGMTLTIKAGTIIKAVEGFENYIVVLRGGKIDVQGTVSSPVTMTADSEEAEAGYWGGLVINGNAPLTSGSAFASVEIDNDLKYGGSDKADNSGSIEYLILEYTGAKDGADVEHNGLTLNGVGNGTTIENVFVVDGSDDGIEFFGGSVNVTGLLVVNSDDDMFDFTQGYSGTLTNAYGVWEAGFSSSESDPSGIEADGNFDGNFSAHKNQSNFKVVNMTIDLQLDYVTGDNTRRLQQAMRIRRGCTANVTNALVKGSGRVETLVNLNDGKGGGNTATSVSLTSELTTAADAQYKYNDGMSAADYPGVKADVAGNAGCSTSVFAWTGYEF